MQYYLELLGDMIIMYIEKVSLPQNAAVLVWWQF